MEIMQFIDLKRQYEHLQPAIGRRIDDVLEHGKYILGPEVRELEAALADFCGARHAIGVGNGTDALLLALMAEDVGPGDAVFTSAFSFFASAEVISLVGATPVFVDIDAETYNICPAALEEAIDSVTRAGRLRARGIIAVDLFGLPANYAAIETVAEQSNLYLIEDAAQSFGAQCGDRKAGQFGKIAATSFFPAKPLGCYGDGGALFTDDDALADRIRSLRVHGKGTDKYDNVRIGTNSRLDTLQAAILLEKLAVFGGELDERERLANEYSARLSESFFVPVVPETYRSAWAQYTVRPRHGTRQSWQEKLASDGIPSAIYYGKPLHLQPAFAALGGKVGQFPIAESCSESVFSLPMHPYMAPEEFDRVVTALQA